MRKEGGFEKTRFLSARNPNVHTLQFNTNVHSTSTFGINTNVLETQMCTVCSSTQMCTNVHTLHCSSTQMCSKPMFTLHCSSVQCMNTNVLETQMCTVCTTVQHKCARTAQQFNRVHICARPKCALFSRFSLSLHNTVL